MKRLESEHPIFPPIKIGGDKSRPTWSVNIALPADIEAEIRQYAEEEFPGSTVVIIHGALYIYRRQFWSREALKAELDQTLSERLTSLENSTITTPQFMEDMSTIGRIRLRRMKALQAEGKIGNLLLPENLYSFILERIDSGECKTPSDVVCAAIPFLRAEKLREKQASQPE